jgi:hypothetical protein
VSTDRERESPGRSGVVELAEFELAPDEAVLLRLDGG